MENRSVKGDLVAGDILKDGAGEMRWFERGLLADTQKKGVDFGGS